MRAAAERLLAPQFREIVRLIDEPILQPIYDLETPRMAFGRVAIIGDAAPSWRDRMSRPGWPRRRTTRTPWWPRWRTTRSSRRCGASRRRGSPVGQRIIERARHLGAYLQATQTAEERARSQRHGIPDAVLAETAVLDFLREWGGASAAPPSRPIGR